VSSTWAKVEPAAFRLIGPGEEMCGDSDADTAIAFD
jgi:hypothetical protein